MLCGIISVLGGSNANANKIPTRYHDTIKKKERKIKSVIFFNDCFTFII